MLAMLSHAVKSIHPIHAETIRSAFLYHICNIVPYSMYVCEYKLIVLLKTIEAANSHGHRSGRHLGKTIWWLNSAWLRRNAFEQKNPIYGRRAPLSRLMPP